MAVVKDLVTVATVLLLATSDGVYGGGRFGLLGGQVAPIEVIEEWGCYDTEIRLTCGNLESRVAILEAKFTPRCADERAEDCVHVDEISMTRSFSSQKVDRLALEEKEAGQRFLQTLRRAHEHERESVPSVGAVQSASEDEAAPVAIVRTKVKDKRSSLRATLEHLIVRYLRRLTSSDEEEEAEGQESTSMRYRRQVTGYEGNGTEMSRGENVTELVTGNEGPDSSVEITLLTNDTEVGNDSSVWGYSVTPTTGESAVESVNTPTARVVTVESEKISRMVNDDGDSDEERVSDEQEDYGPSRGHNKKKVCTSIRKRVAQLDRFELQKSLRNDSFREYNIRNALNYRCSGKNHCSFVFAQDHPYAVVWKEGTVRVKYICMDDFRISKYCEEHLIIGSENRWDRRRNNPRSSSASATTVERDISGRNDDQTANLVNGPRAGFTDDREEYPEYEYDDRDEEETEEEEEQEQEEETQQDREQDYADDGPRGEPRAEALQQQLPPQQSSQQQMHSFHNLKILKTFPGADPDEDSGTAEVALNETEKERLQLEVEAANRKRQRQKVFSQDFRVLKILPSNLDQIEDIKRIGNEYYFKKDVEVVDDAENEIVPPSSVKNDTNNQFTETLDIVVLPAPTTTKDADVYESDLDLPVDSKTTVNVIEPITPTAVTDLTQESVHSTIAGQLDVIQTESTVRFLTPTLTTLGNLPPRGEDSLEKYPAVESNEIEGDLKPSNTSSQDSFSFNNRTFKKIQDTVREEIGEGHSEERYPGSYEDDSEDDDLDDDDDDDYEESEKRGHKKYISIQRTLLKHPLRQGFLMTPGYPKYYIGNSVCRWTLYAKRSQKIKLTILDLALRLDEPCRDYLEIRDLNTNQTLFSGCTESTRPIEVVSLQDRVEVSLRTATQVAYPKRGVLIHYSALGCEPPSPLPPHMTLVRRSERRVRYVCDPLYVFPDTAEPSRELVCTARHTWNRPLPACVEKRATEGSGLVSHYEQKRKISDSDSMSDKQADTVYDIVIPSLVIAALFIVNGIVFAVIMRYRNKRKQRLELDSKELAEL